MDFVVTERRKPLALIECKWADLEVDRGLRYLKALFPDCEAWQISASGQKDYQTAEGDPRLPGPHVPVRPGVMAPVLRTSVIAK